MCFLYLYDVPVPSYLLKAKHFLSLSLPRSTYFFQFLDKRPFYYLLSLVDMYEEKCTKVFTCKMLG